MVWSETNLRPLSSDCLTDVGVSLRSWVDDAKECVVADVGADQVRTWCEQEPAGGLDVQS